MNVSRYKHWRFFQLKRYHFHVFGWITIVYITVVLLFKCMKRNLRTVNWKMLSNLSFLSPAAFHNPDSRTETKPWNQALNHSKPGPSTSRRNPPPMLQLRLGTTFGRKDLLAALDKGRLGHGRGRWCPVQWSRMMGSPPSSMLSPEGESPNTPSSSLCAPMPSALLFPAPILLHCRLVEAQLCTPHQSLGWPSAHSRADYSSQSCSPGPAWAGNRDFLTLV